MIYLQLFWEFLKIGAFTFGGGYAMLPLIEQTVMKHGWLSEKQLIDFIAISESTPGPFAVNISTYIGVRTGGIPGAFCATFGVILPSFLIIQIIAHFYRKFKTNRFVVGAMNGLRPAVAGLIGAAVLSVGGNVFEVSTLLSMKNMIILLILCLAGILAYKKIHPIFIIILCGVMGAVFCG